MSETTVLCEGRFVVETKKLCRKIMQIGVDGARWKESAMVHGNTSIPQKNL